MLNVSALMFHNGEMASPDDWRSKPFPNDLDIVIDDLLPGESDREFGDNWPELRKGCALIIVVVAADLTSRTHDCPIPPTYEGLCRLFRNSPKYLEDWITDIAHSRRNPPSKPAIAQNACAILSVPRRQRDLLFTMMAGFARDYEEWRARSNR